MDTAFGNKLICNTAYFAECKSAETQNSPGSLTRRNLVRFQNTLQIVWCLNCVSKFVAAPTKIANKSCKQMARALIRPYNMETWWHIAVIRSATMYLLSQSLYGVMVSTLG